MVNKPIPAVTNRRRNSQHGIYLDMITLGIKNIFGLPCMGAAWLYTINTDAMNVGLVSAAHIESIQVTITGTALLNRLVAGQCEARL